MKQIRLHLLTCLGAAVAALLTISAIAEIPEALEDIVFGDEKRPTIQTTINGTAFEALTAFSQSPYLMWPREEYAEGVFPADREAGAAWLTRAAEVLGYEGFEARFARDGAWRGSKVWVYELTRRGLVLHDARIEVHFAGKLFAGIVNHTPSPIEAIVDPPAVLPDQPLVFYPVRTHEGGYRVEPARVERSALVDRTVERIVSQGDGTLAMRVSPLMNPEFDTPQLTMFKEFVMPVGSFPDQVSVDAEGLVWISQPNNNLLTSFDPIAETFVQYPTTGGSSPDGMIVGTKGRVWTGMYTGPGLGMLDTSDNTFHNYPAPYGSASMAVPVETSDGHVWVTDHVQNRISEFDPVSETFLQSIIMPTGGCWVVQGHEDVGRGQVYFTEYNANKLGRIAVGGNTVTDIVTPGGGPAFCVYSDDKVYYSRWNEVGIGVLDVPSGTITEYEFPVGGETGGPVWLAPNGKVVIGTRNVGYIMVFDPATQRFAAFRIPTNSPGLKDGLTLGADGTIWFTESGANKLGKLILRPLVPNSMK